MGDAQPWLMARWKAHGRLSIRIRYLLQFRSYKAKCVQLSNCTQILPGHGRPLSTIHGITKLETLGYPTVKTASLCFSRFDTVLECDGRPDRQTDRRICRSIYSRLQN